MWKGLDAEQLAKAAGISSKKRAMDEAKAIQSRMKSMLAAIEVVEYPGQRYAMQLKAEYTSVARKFATKPLLSKAALRTLSFIAYFQPISSADLALRRGSQAYDHLKDLEEVGFLVWERKGRSEALQDDHRVLRVLRPERRPADPEAPARASRPHPKVAGKERLNTIPWRESPERDLVKAVENLRKRKLTGGKRRPFRGRKACEADDYAFETAVGETISSPSGPGEGAGTSGSATRTRPTSTTRRRARP